MGISGLLPTASPIYLHFSLWIHKSFSLKRTLILACFLERKHVEKKLENQVQKQAQFHWRHVTCSQTIPHVPVTTSLITHDGAFPPPPYSWSKGTLTHYRMSNLRCPGSSSRGCSRYFWITCTWPCWSMKSRSSAASEEMRMPSPVGIKTEVSLLSPGETLAIRYARHEEAPRASKCRQEAPTALHLTLRLREGPGKLGHRRR